MHLSTALALASSAGLAASHPLSSLFSRAVAAFPAGSAWEIVLNNKDNVIGDINSVASESMSVIDIDLFDTPASTVSDLKATMTVICYFSAGSKEDWRPDAGDFKEGDFGQGLEGWDGEYWVNVKSENVRAIMKKRIELAAKNGCSAVDPDNVDGFVRISRSSFSIDANTANKSHRATTKTVSATTNQPTSTTSNSSPPPPPLITSLLALRMPSI
jgi:hypothetical protein